MCTRLNCLIVLLYSRCGKIYRSDNLQAGGIYCAEIVGEKPDTDYNRPQPCQRGGRCLPQPVFNFFGVNRSLECRVKLFPALFTQI